jgi:5-methylcytosine-specific restriction endonuclease McrA
MLNRAYYTACPECRMTLLPGQRLHLDHIIPTVRGGSDQPSNLQVTHAACNLSKSDELPPQVRATPSRVW